MVVASDAVEGTATAATDKPEQMSVIVVQVVLGEFVDQQSRETAGTEAAAGDLDERLAGRARSKGAGYRARTRHRMTTAAAFWQLA